jgi:hypothetical protein
MLTAVKSDQCLALLLGGLFVDDRAPHAIALVYRSRKPVEASETHRVQSGVAEISVADLTRYQGFCRQVSITDRDFAGIAEFERDLIRERTGVGREAARKRRVRFGRPRKLSIDQEQLARRLVLEGKSVSDIARTFHVHVATIYRLAQVQ